MESTILKNLVITGANKGIGFGIIDKLLRDKITSYNIILCSRKFENGKEALLELKKKHNSVDSISVEQLDINDSKSVDEFLSVIEKKYDGRIDCLVNNAGTSVNGTKFDTEVFDITVGTNFYSTIDFTEKILAKSLIPSSGKIIIVGSSYGKLDKLKCKELALRFADKDLSIEKLYELSKEFRTAIEKDTWEKEGWPKSAYCISKILINKYAYLLGHRKNILDKSIQVYSCCPGWVRTDMGSPNAHRSLEEGSVTPTFMVNLEYKLNKDLQGRFFYDEKVSDIDNYKF